MRLIHRLLELLGLWKRPALKDMTESDFDRALYVQPDQPWPRRGDQQ